jgi:hypothetical protein
MMITNEDLNSVFDSFDNVVKSTQKKVNIDISDIALNIANETKKARGGDGTPEERVIALSKFVDSISDLLDRADVDEDTGEIFVFEAEEAEKSEDIQEPVEEVSDSAGEEISDAEGEASEEDSIDKEAVDKSDVSWSSDMAPTARPVLRSERLTKKEQVVRARQGALSAEDIQKANSNRAKVFGRERCMA